jgi:hypothetical protein
MCAFAHYADTICYQAQTVFILYMIHYPTVKTWPVAELTQIQLYQYVNCSWQG